MAFSGRQNALIQIKRQGLEVYSPGKEAVTSVFPADLVAAEEVKDAEKFRAQISGFLQDNKLTGLRAVIVLSEELVYQKDISSLDPAEIDTETEKFLSEIPFAPEKIVSKTYTLADKKLVLAVNGELFRIVSEEIVKNGGEVFAIAPITLLPVPIIDGSNYEQIAKDKKLLESANILTEDKEKKATNLKLFLFLIMIFVLVLLGVGFYSRLATKPNKEKIVKMPTQKITARPSTLKPTPGPEETTAPVVLKTKLNLKITVLNGTGKAGDAGKVKKALQALDYQNIDTGNFTPQNADITAIIYALASDRYLSEITAELKKLFSQEPVLVATDSASPDVLIITGK